MFLVLEIVVTEEEVSNAETSRGATLPSTSAIKRAQEAVLTDWKAC